MSSHNHQLRRVRRLNNRRQSEFIDSLIVGEFTGRFYLSWIGPNTFAYRPVEGDPFTFHRKNAQGKVIDAVTPGEMETDGASIPREVWAIPGMSAWDYGPAHLIHDWEFQRHDDDPQFTKSFEEVNRTFAEAMLTLMRVGYLDHEKPRENLENLFTIYSFVSSIFGRYEWDAQPPPH